MVLMMLIVRYATTGAFPETARINGATSYCSENTWYNHDKFDARSRGRHPGIYNFHGEYDRRIGTRVPTARVPMRQFCSFQLNFLHSLILIFHPARSARSRIDSLCGAARRCKSGAGEKNNSICRSCISPLATRCARAHTHTYTHTDARV